MQYQNSTNNYSDVSVSQAVEESVDDALSDGKIDESEAEDILNELASDGEVTAEEVQNLADTLSEDGKLTNAPSNNTWPLSSLLNSILYIPLRARFKTFVLSKV